VKAKSKILSGIGLNGNIEEIIVGPVEENGKDLPSGKNVGDYVNEKGRMDVLKFFEEHKKYFPTLWIMGQHEAAWQVAEVGCERFFGLSGYISSPRRSWLGVRTYKRVAMLASIIQSVYIGNHWVAKQYIEQCKKGSWKKENTEEALTLSCPACHLGVILVLGIHISPNNGPMDMIPVAKLIYYVPTIHFACSIM
jgi:hypothetical protein